MQKNVQFVTDAQGRKTTASNPRTLAKPKQKTALQAIEETLEITRPASTSEGNSKETIKDAGEAVEKLRDGA